MASPGIFNARGTISTNTDTTLIAAPGAGQCIYILWMTFTVSVAGTSSRLRVEAAVGGKVLARQATATADALLNLNYSTGFRNLPGYPVVDTSGNPVALNANTSGAGAATIDYDIEYEIKG